MSLGIKGDDPAFDGDPLSIGTVDDSGRDAEERIRALHRLLRISSAINRNIVRASDPIQLLDEACRIIVGVGGFAAAWIGLVQGESGRLKAVAAQGLDCAVVAPTLFRTDEIADDDRPDGAAARDNRVIPMAGTDAFLGTEIWQQKARRLGVEKIVVLPIAAQDAVLGTLSVWATDEDSLDDEATAVLTDLALDLGHALRRLEVETRRQQHVRALRLNADVLARINSAETRRGAMRGVVDIVRQRVEVESVGLRLEEGAGFPYYETAGFPAAFVSSENDLCARDAEGMTLQDERELPVLDCLCGAVIRGQVNPELKFVTEHGSFWTNRISDLPLLTMPRNRRGLTRIRCQHDRYESVALIPIRSGQKTIGLLQLNDRRRDRFSDELIRWLEEISDVIAVAVARWRAEESLRGSEERYRELFENNLAGVFRAAGDGRVLECNDAFANIFGYDGHQQILDVGTLELCFKRRDRLAFLTALNEQGEVKNHEIRIRRRSGGAAWCLVNASLVGGENADGPLIEGMLIDVTGRKEIEEQLIHAQKLEAVGRLAGGVAHDFNNLLQAISGVVFTLEEEESGSTTPREVIDELEEYVSRGAQLTRQLLLFSRRDLAAPELLEINHVVAENERLLRRILREDVAITVELSDENPLVFADSGHISQVLMNFAVNAQDAMPLGGRLAIRTAVDADRIVLEVEDSGSGIPKNDQARIFEPFFTTKKIGEGTGLGLSVVRDIVHLWKGEVNVESEEGRGSRFRVRIPRYRVADDAESAPFTAPDEPGQIGQPGRGEKILVVDDDERIRKILYKALTRSGYRVQTADGAAEATRVHSEHPFDLVLTDVVLSDGSGVEILEHVLVATPGCARLLMTGYSPDVVNLNDSAIPVLRKPFNLNELSLTIRDTLARIADATSRAS